jgi:osmotically-inducible protein OsmY
MPSFSPAIAAPTESAAVDLKNRITSFLNGRGVPSSRLNIEVMGGTVTLQGSVSTFYQRQLCISCCQHVAGVLRLVDQLTVR